MSSRFIFGIALSALLVTGGGLAEEDRHSAGAVEQSGGAVSQDVKLPVLNLSNAQREQIRKGVLARHSEIEFRLTSTKSAKDFEPKVGATLPSGLVPEGFPDSVLQQLPQLRNFGYLKMKDRVLIIDATNRKIVDMFSKTQPLT